MTKLFKQLKLREWIFAAISLVFIVAQVWLDLKLPEYMKEITMIIQTENGSMNSLWEAGGYMLLCALGSALAAVIVGYFSAQISASFAKNMRAALFNKVESFSMEEINKFSTSSLITRSTNDITQVQMIIAMGLQVIIKAPIMAVWAITKIAGKSWQWSVATAVAIFIILIVIVTLVMLVMPKFKIVQKLTDNLNMVTRENLTGIRVVHAYNAEEFEEKKFEKANNDLTKTNLFTQKSMGVMMPIMSLVMNSLSLSIYWIGAIVINNAAGMADKLNNFSDMIIFSSYAMQVVMSFMMLTMIFIMLPRATVSAKRINEVLDTESAIKDGANASGNSDVTGEIELKNVSFKYPSAAEYVLKDVNLSIKKGETVAFIGSTGSGKSTLINLVPRFYDVTDGEILVDGINVKDYTLHNLHNKIGYVPQQAVMFAGTIKSNVAYGESLVKDMTEEDVEHAVTLAQGSEFVEKLADKYDSPIAQGGTNVSGGQKQRLAIARALARKPEFLIFDDSFSALDYKTDRALRTALKAETSHTTTLIVAQRIGTIKDADKIVVLDSGSVVGVGTHKELLHNCEIYKEIAYSQLSKEELANE